MKYCSLGESITFFVGEHGLCFAEHHRGAQPKGWHFGTPRAPTESKPRPSRRSDRGSEGLLLGTQPSVRSPKVREDKTSGTLKSTKGSERRRCPSSPVFVSEDEDGQGPGDTVPWRGVSSGPHDLCCSGRRGLPGVAGPLLSCSALIL